MTMIDSLATRAELVNRRHGAASAVTGGAMGELHLVENANNKGSGSLRDAAAAGDGWVAFDDDFIIKVTGEILVAPNTTIDGRGRQVTIQPQASTIALRFDAMARGPVANIIVANLSFSTGPNPGPNSKAMFFGGGGAGQPGGGCDLVWLDHLSLSDLRDTPIGFGGFGGHTSRGTVSWCRFGPNPGPVCWHQNITGGTAPSRDGKAIRLGGDPEDTTEHPPGVGCFTVDHNLFEHCNERQPFGNGTDVHAYNNVVRKWGTPDGIGSVAMNPRRYMRLLDENNVFDPYLPGERHHFSDLSGTEVIATAPDKRAVYSPPTDPGVVIDSRGNLLLNGATDEQRNSDVIFVPAYGYTLDAADQYLQAAVIAGAGQADELN